MNPYHAIVVGIAAGAVLMGLLILIVQAVKCKHDWDEKSVIAKWKRWETLAGHKIEGSEEHTKMKVTIKTCKKCGKQRHSAVDSHEGDVTCDYSLEQAKLFLETNS